MDKEIDVIFLFCPPLSQYKDPPSDVSPCELVSCPSCREKMWFSEKKKMIKQQAEENFKEVIWECYVCFKKRVMANPSIFKDHVRVDI